jgi:cation diffusion facilitator CzcD-associated flavoprotein CzcO
MNKQIDIEELKTDFLIIGTGIAGLYGYLYLKDGFPSFFGEEE